MDGFKNSTKTKYMCGGPVKKGNGGGVFNERGQRATWAEVAAEGRRMEGRKPPVEGISTRPTDDKGRRMTDAELNLGRATAKKTAPKAAQTPMKKGGMAKKGVPVASKRPMVGLAAMPKKK